MFFNWTQNCCLILLCKHLLCWTGFILTFFFGISLQSLNDNRGAPLHFIMIDGTWSNSKAMVSRLQVCLWIFVIFWYWIFDKSSISGIDLQIVTARSVDQWVWFPFDYLVDHDSLPEEYSPCSWLAKQSSPWTYRWCSKAATNLCRLSFWFCAESWQQCGNWYMQERADVVWEGSGMPCVALSPDEFSSIHGLRWAIWFLGGLS